MNDSDVIDRASGLAPGDSLHTARRFRAKVVEATQASHDALLMQPVPGLSPADRLRVAVHACEAAGAMVVSVTNGCVYCTSVHAQRFAQLARRQDTVEQVFDDPASAGTTERERAIARFAIAVTTRPQALGADDIEPLRGVGMNDEEIIDLLHAVAIFGWANRLMQNLGEPASP